MIELKLLHKFPREIIALDEVGRSPLSGPVVIGALRVVVPDRASLEALLRSFRRLGVKDSKLLSHEQRQELLQKFQLTLGEFRERKTFSWKGLALQYLTWEMDHEVIDRENIFQASMRGMREAAMALAGDEKENITVLIDGQVRLKWPHEPYPWEELAIVKGDVKSPLIGLAAILAKEKRDGHMRDMHILYPQYGFESNFGYPTAFHREAIRLHGPCSIHRKSFGKVKEFIRRN